MRAVSQEERKARGWQIVAEPYANIFEVAKKKSGKTVALIHMLKKFVGKNTKTIVFASTFYKDPEWITIRKVFQKNGLCMLGFTSLRENGMDMLQKLVKELEAQAEAEEKEKEANEDKKHDPKPKMVIRCNDDETAEEKKRKPKKSKYITPEYIFVFDDLSDELKSPSLVSLLKKNRHFRCKVIISSQYLKDLKPESRKQIDIWMLFHPLPSELLEIVHKDAGLATDYQHFLKMYQSATQEKYSFLYVDVNNEEYRKNFNRSAQLKE